MSEISNKEINDKDVAEVFYEEEIARSLCINEAIARGDSQVQQFYAGAVVLVTGGSGFLGKQLIEKLFRSCQIKKMYILLRQNKQRSLHERVDYILEDELYDYLRKNKPDFVDKLIPITGDITEHKLGLSEYDWRQLTKEVNVIFHVAATVNFLEPLRVATLTNVRGTREMITLAKACMKLQSFVYISTAYCHATAERVKQPVLEQFYQAPITPDLLIQLAEQLDVEKMNDITPQLLGSWPNTYAFTKAVAEEVVRTSAGDLPICIVRPAIVMQSYQEPPGWADMGTIHYSAIGFIVGICVGGLHVLLAKPETRLDIVPVDVVNNTAIVAAQETASLRSRGVTDVKIYTVGRSRNPFTMGKLIEILNSKRIIDIVTPKILWYPYCITTWHKPIYFLLSWILHFIPGYLVDGILSMLGKKPKVIKLFDKAYKQNKVYAFYTFNDWQFDDTNLFEMSQKLSPSDQIIYNCKAFDANVEDYIFSSSLGARKYIFKDGLKNTEYAKKKLFWLGILNAIYLVVYAFTAWKFFALIFKVLRVILSLMLFF